MTQDAAGFSTETGPNSIQIGGDHYVSDYQPWDFNEHNGLGGLECSIVKYICRYKTKGAPFRDISKAIHYVDKLIDLHEKVGRVPRGCAGLDDVVKFSQIQNLGTKEDTALTFIARWSCLADLHQCRAALLRIIEELEANDGH